MDWINYNQFYYFWIIARELSVTKAAALLRVSQSNLSEQMKTFESTIGQQLFDRKGRNLVLTESGRLAFEYANSIFSTGQEMVELFKNRPTLKSKVVIRIGALNSLSKNLQFEFVRPLLRLSNLKIVVIEADLPDLVRQLQAHTLDVVVSNMPVRTDSTPAVFNHRLGEIQVSLVGTRAFQSRNLRFPQSLDGAPIFLPSRTGRFRNDFEAWLQREKIYPDIRGEIEDMALLRLFALSGEGMALVPEIVVKRELESGQLIRIKKLQGFTEAFFAVTTTRKFPNHHIERIVRSFASKN
jgi:LysR family transcriptional activator of nhaA